MSTPPVTYRVDLADLMAIADAACELDGMKQFYVDQPYEIASIKRQVDRLHWIVERAAAQDAVLIYGADEEVHTNPEQDIQGKVKAPHKWPKPQNFIFCSGEANPISSKIADRRFYAVHITPKIDEACEHDWENGSDGSPERCGKCGLSFTRYVHCCMP